jgi:hypothetical protein
MKMRVAGLVLAAVMGATAPALAYENYIPLGTGYSASVSSLPQFDSEEGIIASRADVYETELYLRARKRAEDDSRLRQFFSDSNATDSYIDY